MSQTPSVDTYTQEPPLTEDFPPAPPLTEDFPPEPSLNEGIPADPTLYIEDSSIRDIGSKINQNLSGMKKRISDKYSNMKIEAPDNPGTFLDEGMPNSNTRLVNGVEEPYVKDDLMYIGIVQMNLNDGKKRKFLYFQSDYKIKNTYSDFFPSEGDRDDNELQGFGN